MLDNEKFAPVQKVEKLPILNPENPNVLAEGFRQSEMRSKLKTRDFHISKFYEAHPPFTVS